MSSARYNLIKNTVNQQGFGLGSRLDITLVFCIKDIFVRKDFYRIRDNLEHEMFVLHEFYYCDIEEEGLIIYSTFDELIFGLKNYEYFTHEKGNKTWWSYCDNWLFLEPLFIDDEIKPLLGNEIVKMLSEICMEDLREIEEERFLLWMEKLFN
jgi:hypothetical protein